MKRSFINSERKAINHTRSCPDKNRKKKFKKATFPEHKIPILSTITKNI